MRLLVAGWQGQIARALIEVAPSRSDVTACAIGRPALNICEAPSIERALGDIRPDVVINTAAYTAVDKAESEPEQAFALNSEGARMLAAAAARRGVPIIHISTDYVFDGAKGAPYVESDPTAPATVFGKSKLAGEEGVAAANPRHVILRTAWVHSPFGRNFVSRVLARAQGGEQLEVVADQRGSPTYAPHLVDIILGVAARVAAKREAGDPIWGVYHAAGSGGATWLEVAREVVCATPDEAALAAHVRPISSGDRPTPATRPTNAELDCGKLARVFGLALPPWQEGVAACVSRLAAAA